MTITQLERALAEARKDEALFTRLSEAQERAAALQAELDTARATAQTAQEAERHAARFDGVTDVQVREAADGKVRAGDLLGTMFDITFTRLSWNMSRQESLPVDQTVRGFTAVPSGALAYLIERRPERVPAAIAALAPGDLREAFGIYLRAKRRGHL